MNKRNCLFSGHKLPVRGLVLGLSFLIWGSASAQLNYLRNGDFEQPLGPTNWTVGYLLGGADDFHIKDRSRGGNYKSTYGGYLQPLTLKLAHAYFGQTVSNLTTSHVYKFTGVMKEDWWSSVSDPKRDKYLVYIELIGGQGSPHLDVQGTPDGRFSVIATNDLKDATGTADTNIDGPPYYYPTPTWRTFYAQQIPDANRKIEVRLHYNKVDFATYSKDWISTASYDNCALNP
jgi:hypothetical protein